MIYDFSRLINKYSVPITVSKPLYEEHYERGRLVKEERAETVMRGAVVPMAEKKVYQSGGYYTASDRQLYMKTPIGDCSEGIQVSCGGRVYNVEEDTDYSNYGNIFAYVLKQVSSFDKTENN